jgi:hypothetical protein
MIGSALNGLMTAFANANGGTSGDPYVELLSVINDSPPLEAELNTAANSGFLTAISSEQINIGAAAPIRAGPAILGFTGGMPFDAGISAGHGVHV